MKLQIAFDMSNLEKALEIATQVADQADILEVGTLLLYSHGVKAVKLFKEQFPRKQILADTKIIDRGKEAISIFADAGADWVTVMAGTGKDIIHAACTAAHQAKVQVMLDLVDSAALGQSALEAKNLGVDALLFHQAFDEKESLMFHDKWEMVRGNTQLPVFISAKITRDTINYFMSLKSDGIIIGKSITDAPSPIEEALYFKELVSR
ncbi:3-hexulose-6-phosphate synthase [Candidatus Dependentiae bacterium Noda2021]|nr:3-hexulose-6-phosphate synthase [Candidatus Dependentiae bacterium Noda2021]